LVLPDLKDPPNEWPIEVPGKWNWKIRDKNTGIIERERLIGVRELKGCFLRSI
jgi:hypothetical protein